MTQAYRVLQDSSIGDAKAGDIVYAASGYDYGLASDDTRLTGVDHISVTRKRNGGYPCFTIPVSYLEKCSAPLLEQLTIKHVESVCQPGRGEATCRYLTMSGNGFGCDKHTELADYLDELVRTNSITAKGNNCEGRRGNV